jgi:hypothetical protein
MPKASWQPESLLLFSPEQSQPAFHIQLNTTRWISNTILKLDQLRPFAKVIEKRLQGKNYCYILNFVKKNSYVPDNYVPSDDRKIRYAPENGIQNGLLNLPPKKFKWLYRTTRSRSRSFRTRIDL